MLKVFWGGFWRFRAYDFGGLGYTDSAVQGLEVQGIGVRVRVLECRACLGFRD